MAFSSNRYEQMPYNRVGQSGLKLPAISLGMWHNFGADDSIENQRALLTTAYELGITHFDLADNYGNGMAEVNVGESTEIRFRRASRPARYLNEVRPLLLGRAIRGRSRRRLT